MAALRRFIRVKRTSLSRAVFIARTFKGCMTLGSGSYARVIAHPTNEDRVLKITAGYDKAYVKYIKTILRLRKHSPWLPRVYDAYFVVAADSGYREDVESNRQRPYLSSAQVLRNHSFLVVELDRMRPLNDAPAGRFREAELLTELSGRVEYSLDSPDPCPLVKSLTRLGIKVDRLAQVANAALNRQRKRYRSSWDLHQGNLMWQGQQLVFTDPVCS